MRGFTAKRIAVMGMLVALEAIIARFGTLRPTESIRISLDFIPIVVTAVLFGPVPAMIISILADVLGAFLFPVGPYFPGFTVTAALTGLLYGLMLYRSQAMPRVAAAVLLHQGILSLLLNTLWLKVLYGMPYWPTLAGRLPQCGILIVLEMVLIPIIARNVQRIRKQVRE